MKATDTSLPNIFRFERLSKTSMVSILILIVEMSLWSWSSPYLESNLITKTFQGAETLYRRGIDAVLDNKMVNFEVDSLPSPIAKVTLIELIDSTLPVCESFSGVVESLSKTFKSELRVVVKNSPLKEDCTPVLYLNGRRFIAPLSVPNLEVAIRLLLTEKE